MALVMLPCELPWWMSLQRHLKHLQLASSTQKLTDGMLKIHEMCNISLDPDEDEKDPNIMQGFANYLDNDLTEQERLHFMDHTLPAIIHRALHLKQWKPAGGLNFSLQQQSDFTELSYDFVSSLLAHAFFSTYPKRTLKTHPTLQDFNFTYFFKHLDRPCQKAKLRSIMNYFDNLGKDKCEGTIKISRQVMNSKQWLTIEDWIECSLPLCKLQIRHEGRMEKCDVAGMEMCFSSSRLGGDVLGGGDGQESMEMCSVPELLVMLLSVEALEDNEIIRVEGGRRFTYISDAKQNCFVDKLETPKPVSVCCIDAENYSTLPLSQYMEDNILRELNKCLLGFQQKPLKPVEHPRNMEKRLSPIGESFSHTPPEVEATVIIKQTSTSTIASLSSRSTSPDAYCATTINLNDPSVEFSKNKCYLSPEMNTLNNRRGRFIVLGSSGECLPVKRPTVDSCDSLYSSCNSSFEEYHSANDSINEDSDDDVERVHKYNTEMDTAERRTSFAQRLKDALRREMETSNSSFSDSVSTNSSYAVGISIAGAGLEDKDIRLTRGNSGGFVLAEDSLDEEFLNASLQQEQEWLTRFRSRRSPGVMRKETNDSSKYSFSTDYSSDLEEVYEQFSQWLDEPIPENGSEKKKFKEFDSRDIAVIRFASSLLKRTLSESFAGVSLTDGIDNKVVNRQKLVKSVRSLSLELAKHKHKLAAQLSLQLPNEESLNSNGAEKQILIHKPLVIVNNVNNEKTDTNNTNGVHSNPIKLSINDASKTISRQASRKSQHSRQSSLSKQTSIEGKRRRPKNKLAWVIDCITEVIEQNIECEPITLKLRKPKLSQLANRQVKGSSIQPIISGNWGCGTSHKGDPQLKLIIQWMAASVAGAPCIIYYTKENSKLFKLDTLLRVLTDRKWTVGHLATAALKFAQQTLNEPHVIHNENTLFDELIGIEKFVD